MRCPFCKDNNDKVIDSRESTDAFIIRRRRECLACGRRFTTRERIDETPLRVVKKDESREEFDRRKILGGMITACQKRAVSMQALEEITQRIEEKLLDGPEREVSSRTIGSMVMKELKKLDKVAYVRFASVYKNFESPEDFAEIAGEVIDEAKTHPPKPARAAPAGKGSAKGGGAKGSAAPDASGADGGPSAPSSSGPLGGGLST
jgi:transcriptional repressor NrdR